MKNKSFKPPDLPPETPPGTPPGITDPAYWEDNFQGVETGIDPSSLLKYFLEPGDEAQKLLMRCVFNDERQLNAAILAMDRYEEFCQERHKIMLLRRLAGSVSIGGRSRAEGLMAGTRLLAPNVMSAMLGIKQSKEEKQNSVVLSRREEREPRDSSYGESR